MNDDGIEIRLRSWANLIVRRPAVSIPMTEEQYRAWLALPREERCFCDGRCTCPDE